MMKLFGLKMRLIAPLAVVCCFIGVGSQPAQAQTGETIFISTFSDHQILRVVDTGFPSTATVINADPTATPEDIVVGPDGKIYVCDADQNRIRRITMTGDGNTVEPVYDFSTNSPTQCTGGNCPQGPEGPSFNTLGDLYFNTRDGHHSGVWKIPASQLSSIPSVGGPTVVNVVTAAQTGSTFGEGTTFDANDKLLFVDRSGGKVWRFDPAAITPLTAIITGLSNPYGIAVNSAGDIFVSNHDTHQVLRYNSAGGETLGAYVDFSCVGECGTSDSPAYLQFDASDRLFVVTFQTSTDFPDQFGKVWRVDPSGLSPSTGTQHQLVALTGAALGLGLPATTFTTQQQSIAPGTTTTFKDGTIIDQAVQLPSNVILNDAAFMAVNFIQFAPGVFNSTRLPAGLPNTWSGGAPVPPGTTCTPIDGTGGNCIVAENLCFKLDHSPILPCNIIAPTTLIQLTSHYDTQSLQTNPGLIIATDGQKDWADITDAFSDCCLIGGGTKGLNSDEAIVNLPPITDTSSIIREIGILLNAGCIEIDDDDRDHDHGDLGKDEEVRAGIAKALISKLSEAQEAINAGNIRKAINILTALKKQIQAQSGKHIATSCTIGGVTFNPVTVLLSAVQSLIDSLKVSVIPDPITGYIVNSGGAGILGATVSIVDSALHTVATATSDITGFYFFPTMDVLTSGSSYTVQVTALPSGFTTSTPVSQSFIWQGEGIVLSIFVLN
jgi:sugar lactone lactonase YvrE